MQNKELKEKVLVLRRIDDVRRAVRGSMTRMGRWGLRRFSQITSYGEELKLLMTDGDEAFGFEWREQGEVLTIRQDEKWVDKDDHPAFLPKRDMIYGAEQWDSQRVRRGVLPEYILRLVDCPNQGEEDVQRSMRRLAVALLDAGRSHKLIRKVIQRAKQEVLSKIEKVTEEVLG